MFDSLGPVIAQEPAPLNANQAPGSGLITGPAMPAASTPNGAGGPPTGANPPVDPVALLTEAVSQLKVAIAALTYGVDRDAGTLPGVIMSVSPGTAASAAGAPATPASPKAGAKAEAAASSPTTQANAATQLSSQVMQLEQDVASFILQRQSNMFAGGMSPIAGYGDAMLPFPAPSFLGSNFFGDENAEPAL